jgi:hypothetical protein
LPNEVFLTLSEMSFGLHIGQLPGYAFRRDARQQSNALKKKAQETTAADAV